MKSHMAVLQELFWTFFKIGPSSFGGGYAMMPVIEREVVANRQWFTDEEMANMLSLAGTAPGGVAVNTAAFVGYRKAGLTGAVAAVIGVTLPTLLMVIFLSTVYLFIRDQPKAEAALRGVHAAVVALILMAAYRMAKVSVFDMSTTCVAAAVILILLLLDINPLFVILLGLVVGIAIVKGKEWIGLEVRTEKHTGPLKSSGVAEPEYFI